MCPSFRTFGCIGHVKKTKPILTKLEDSCYLGYDKSSKAYRLYDPHGGKVVLSQDVVFDKKAPWDWDDLGAWEGRGVGGMFVIEHLVIHGGGDEGGRGGE